MKEEMSHLICLQDCDNKIGHIIGKKNEGPLKIKRLEDELGVIETPARIHELRSEGYDIQSTRKQVLNRYGETVNIAEWFIR